MLYPQVNKIRNVLSLDGVWDFKLAGDDIAIEQLSSNSYFQDAIAMPVPASYNDIYPGKSFREHSGNVVYRRSFSVNEPMLEGLLWLRFESVTHRATAYLNGQLLGEHIGGFLPFEFEISNKVSLGENEVIVVVNNIVDYSTLPCGRVQVIEDSTGKATRYNFPNFDFFNYSGIMRPVKLYSTPTCYIQDVSITADSKGNVTWDVDVAAKDSSLEGDQAGYQVAVEIKDADGEVVFRSEQAEGHGLVDPIKTWSTDHPYLYGFCVKLSKAGKLVDVYDESFGFRTVEVKPDGVYLNGHKVYLKGFGKHEDFPVIGRGFNEAVNVKDIALLKWMGANSFRTSHYPYSEEMMYLCDREGILVIDEVPAVGLNIGFSATGLLGGDPSDTWSELTTGDNHRRAIEELVKRDKNHPCVIMWSVANEPASQADGALEYFAPMFDLFRTLDPQKRPVTLVTYDGATAETCKIPELCDVICINRYYGWYQEEYSLDLAAESLRKTFTSYRERCPDKPIMLTEYGADTIAGMHDINAGLFSEEYQVEFLKTYSKVLDEFDFVAGEHVWNFADFATAANIKRVQGNKKGAFTREREPKMAAWYLRDRWKNKNSGTK